MNVGAEGEHRARVYLESIGLTFREANARVPGGELDLVMEDKKTGELVFVEVRTRRGSAFGTPEESIGAKKQRALTRSIAHYCQHANWYGPYRLDVVGVTVLDADDVKIEHTAYVTLA